MRGRMPPSARRVGPFEHFTDRHWFANQVHFTSSSFRSGGTGRFGSNEIQFSAVFEFPHPFDQFAADLVHHHSPIALTSRPGGLDYERLRQIGNCSKKDV